jgi:hypothetical protein
MKDLGYDKPLYILPFDHRGCREDCEGIAAGTARRAFEAGANVFVAGTSVFGDPGGPAMGIRGLAEALNPQLQSLL